MVKYTLILGHNQIYLPLPGVAKTIYTIIYSNIMDRLFIALLIGGGIALVIYGMYCLITS